MMFQPNMLYNFLRLVIVLLVFGITTNVAQAQDFEEWKKNYLNEFDEFQNEYDKEFYETLQKEWEDFKSQNSPDFYEEPKPKTIPSVEKPSPPTPKPQKSKERKDPATGNQQNKTIQKTEKRTSADNKKKNTTSDLRQNQNNQSQTASHKDKPNTKKSVGVNPSKGISPNFTPNIEQAEIHAKQLNYFGIPIDYKYYAAYEKQLGNQVNQKAIADFWKHLSTKDYPSFLTQIQQVRSQLSLNDYGYAQLLNNIGSQIYGPGTNEAVLFTWFMLTQSNFDTKIAYKESELYVLVAATPHTYQKSATIDGTRYYNLKFDKDNPELPSSFYTYQGSHGKGQKKSLDLLFDGFPPFPQEKQQRDLQFTFRDSTYKISLPVDMKAINYFKEYPQAGLDLYFNSNFEGETYTQLVKSLRPLLQGKSILEQVNLLLRFTQRSFEYETDRDQFNYEKKMFPVETIYYPASDCDDRSIMFGYLLNELTDLDYLVLRYPKHLTIAVHFPSGQEPSGDRVNEPIIHEGKRYYVSDPTYFGADVGIIMPQYRNTKPSEIFDL
ncbi:hypothetical protein [Fodinibius sp. Rm-B-1B1-1]|uniref:hypothetical protein n=1 Tax=Fodinibius alkaliphilus TaxID=3140241 RepID=UPI00315A0D38